MTLLSVAESLTQPDLVQSEMIKPPRTFTLYLVRHGEAVHNVEEKMAKKKALQSSLERGLRSDDKETIRLVEQARKEVLKNPAFFDAELTNVGKSEARCARAHIERCVQEGLPSPEEVLTSPLQRCLGTVDEIFPEQDILVRVEEDLRERLTGRPADNRHSSEGLEAMFPRFDFARLRSLSQSNLTDSSLEESDVSYDDFSRQSSFEVASDSSAVSSPMSSPPRPSQLRLKMSSSTNANVELEDESAVRKRAFSLFRMLQRSSSDAVAVVTHKGFLRALEQGCFGLSESPEFKNCEVRVYRIEMTPGNLFLNSVVRLR